MFADYCTLIEWYFVLYLKIFEIIHCSAVTLNIKDYLRFFVEDFVKISVKKNIYGGYSIYYLRRP